MELRTVIKKFTFGIFSPLSIKSLINITNQKLICPFYHTISNFPVLHTKHLYPHVSTKQFENDLDFLLKHYSPATVQDLNTYIQNKKKSRKPYFFLSFDDGMRECYDVIFPILKRKGIPATFFLNSSFIDNKLLFHKHKCSIVIDALNSANKNTQQQIARVLGILEHDYLTLKAHIKKLNYYSQSEIDSIATLLNLDFDEYLLKQQPYLTTPQVKELIRAGFNIGGHSTNHPEFFLLNNQQIIEQINGCFSFLNTQFGIKDRYFSFPFTDDKVSQAVFNHLSEVDYKTISFGTAGLKKDINTLHVQRIPMETNNFKKGEDIIQAEYAYYILKSLFRKNTVKRA